MVQSFKFIRKFLDYKIDIILYQYSDMNLSFGSI